MHIITVMVEPQFISVIITQNSVQFSANHPTTSPLPRPWCYDQLMRMVNELYKNLRYLTSGIRMWKVCT